MFAPFIGKSDDEIRQQAALMGGMDTLVISILNGMVSSINPNKAQDAVIGYHLTDPDGDRTYAIVVEGTTGKVEPRPIDDARTTYKISAADFMRLLSGEIDGAQAFQAGRVEILGDQMFAMQTQGMFGG